MHQLPEGIVFASDAQVSDQRAAALTEEGAVPPPGGGGSSPPIMFYADGTASEASVTVTSPSGSCISINLRGLTAYSRLSDVFSGTSPAGAAAGGTP